MIRPWIRELIITLTSKENSSKLIFGVNQDEFNINVSGNKYMSALKDTCTIKIDNLTYDTIARIIAGKYYEVEVRCGYKNTSTFTIFNGEILNISNGLNRNRTTSVYILCASKLVARYGQSRMNFSLNSGINIYSALSYMAKAAGIEDFNISDSLKLTTLENISSYNASISMILDEIAKANPTFVVNTDSSIASSVFSVYNALNENPRIINLTSDMINLEGGYPKLDSSGLSFTITPTVQILPGDVIKIDNSLINIYTQSYEPSSMYKGHFLDEEGCYTVYQEDFDLENRGNSFSISLLCKSRNLLRNIIGKGSDVNA